jgi:hypothetical protein
MRRASPGPHIGYQSAKEVTNIALRSGMTAGDRPGMTSGPVEMVDGTWGYWTTHDDKGHDGMVLLPAGRVIQGHDWARWERGGCDIKHPTVWNSRNCWSKWKLQVDMYGHLTDRLP